MSSFKLESGGTAKQQAKAIGVLLVIMGLITGLLIHPIGWAGTIIGLILVLAAAGASE